MSEPAPRRSIPGPIIVLPILVIAGVAVSIAGYWLFSKAHSAPGPPPSIAVLPFESKSARFLGDGVTVQVIDELSPIPDFLAIARTSTFALRGEHNVQEIGRKLNVRTVMLGSLERSGDRVQVSARLISAQDGAQLWSKNYDRASDEIFAIEDEIAREIVDALGLRLPVPLDHAAVTTVEAYHSYLRARSWRLEGDEPAQAAILYKKAIALDPRYAPAYAGLAEDSLQWAILPGNWEGETADARAEALKALELDPRLALPHVVLGELKANTWDWRSALGEFERALAINSADPHAMRALAMLNLAPMGHVKDAISEMNRVLDLDPLDPAVRHDLGLLLYLDREFDAAVAQLKDLNSPHVRFLLAQIRGGEAEQPNAFAKACSYARAGDPAHAMDSLEEAYQQRDPDLAYLKTWPAFDALRSDPRFQALLKKLNLA